MNMKIFFTKTMTKQYWRLPGKERGRVDAAIVLFRHNPFAAKLRNHPLKGKMQGQRSLSVGFDLRIIFEEHDGYAVVIMIELGTHDEVY